MLYKVIGVFLIASICGAQTPMPATEGAANSSVQALATAGTSSDTITVAPGTMVPLTLINPIQSKSTKPGGTVRAVVAFPVTVGAQVAIPAGTYVEGMVNSVTARDRHTHLPTVQIHFTRLLYANGYSVPLDALNSEAFMILPSADSQASAEIADARAGAPFLGKSFMLAGQMSPPPQPPPLPPLPSVGPNPAVVVGAALGGTAAFLVIALILSHGHGMNSDYLLFDNGWQFQMVLQSPLTLDARRVAALAPAAH